MFNALSASSGLYRLLASRAAGLYRSPFTRSVAGLMAFTAAGHAVYLLTGPIIGRIFSPAEFGLFGIFFTIASTATLFVCLNYDLAIPAAATDEEAVDLTTGARFIAVLMSFAAGLGLAFATGTPALGVDVFPGWSGAILGLILLAQANVQIAQSWRVRKQDTLVIGQASVTLNVTRGAVQILLGLFSPFWWALAGGEFAGRLANLAHLRRGSGRSRAGRPDAARIGRTLAAYRQFPTVLLPAQALDSLAFFVQMIGVGLLLGTGAVGQYFLMRRTLDLPVAFAFRSLSDIFYARLANDARTAPERVRPFFLKAFLLLAAAGAIGILPIIFWGPDLFRLFFGPAWGEAGALAAIMAPAMVMNLAVAPISRVFALTSRPHLRYAFSLANLLGSLLVLWLVGAKGLGLTGITIGFAISMFVSYAVYFVSGLVACAHLQSADIVSLGPEQG